MLRRRVIVALGVLLAFAGCADVGTVLVPENSKIIMLRHADRDEAQLSDQGRARAQALVTALKGVEIDAIYAPNIQRNLDTAAPLATARGMEIQVLERFEAITAFLEIAEMSAGRSIVWVGNKDNIAPIWDALELEAPGPLEYGDLFIVERAGSGMPEVLRLQYGAE